MEIGVKKSIKTIERIFQKEVNYILNRIAKK